MVKPARDDESEEKENEPEADLQGCVSWVESLDLCLEKKTLVQGNKKENIFLT